MSRTAVGGSAMLRAMDLNKMLADLVTRGLNDAWSDRKAYIDQLIVWALNYEQLASMFQNLIADGTLGKDEQLGFLQRGELRTKREITEMLADVEADVAVRRAIYLEDIQAARMNPPVPPPSD